MANFLRTPNTTIAGLGFSSDAVQTVWQKGTIIAGYDSALWRKDTCGMWIYRHAYGDTNSKYGWEIDHVQPVARNGSDHLSNLQPLHWENNRHKSDNYPQWYCKLKAA